MEYIGLGVLAMVVLGGAALLARLLHGAQEGDSSKRGQDSARPGGFYTDSHSGGSY